ncbi:MAG: cytochrome c oxidase assembly factor Coa1 family protein [Polyangiaceae bacterium]
MQQPPYPPAPPPYGQQLPPAPGAPRPTWLSKNLGWVVSVGCLSMILLGCLFVMSIFGVATTAMKASDAYAIAMSTAERDPVVLAELGAPLKPGWFVSGSVNVSGSTGHADLSIPVSGSVRSGKLIAIAEKVAGAWVFSKLQLTVDGRPGALDLLPKLTAAPTPSPPSDQSKPSR